MRTRHRAKVMDANNVQTEEDDAKRTTISQFQEGSALLRLAPEIITRILVLVGQQNVSSLAEVATVCRLLGWYIYQDPNKALWREIHNHHFDDPRNGLHHDPRKTQPHDWQKAVVGRWSVMQLLGEDIFEEALDARIPVLKGMSSQIGSTLLSMYRELPPAASSPHSLNGPLIETLIGCRTFEKLYTKSFHAVTPPAQPITHVAQRVAMPTQNGELILPDSDLAQLHVLRPWFSAAAERANFDLMPDARPAHFRNLAAFKKITYNVRHYNAANDYGPFHEDGTVNWPVIDAITQTMDANVTYVTGNSPFRGSPSSRYAYRDWAFAKPPADCGVDACRGVGFRDVAKEDKNWAKVDGHWRGSYAFMDYTDWMEYNFNSMQFGRRRPEPVEMESYIEAVGDYMSMDITTELTEFTKALPALEYSLPISNALPPITFNGTSKNRTGHGGAVGGAHLRGRVALTLDDPPQVRWTWVVRYDNEDRWRIEAVQIGGRGSKRGLIGVWSDVERGALSPVGPIQYWPITPDELEEETARLRAYNHANGILDDHVFGLTDDDESDGDFASGSEMLSEETDGDLVSEGDDVFMAS